MEKLDKSNYVSSRLEYKINNHDDLLSFAQIDIFDTDVSYSNQINSIYILC